MISIPFTKLHGAENDFLLTWGDDAPNDNLPEIARRICARTTGIGADGWMLVWPSHGGVRTRLFNSDGSAPEMSGNGTRCAAAFAILENVASPPDIAVTTAAGLKMLRLISRDGARYVFEMNMGQPQIEELRSPLTLLGNEFNATILNVGNPQCAIFVPELPSNWQDLARAAQALNRFPHGANVSFVRAIDRHAIDVVFFERGVGETRSSGTGSTAAAVAAILRNVAESPVDVNTPAGILNLRWDDDVYLTGPAEIIGEGRFFLDL